MHDIKKQRLIILIKAKEQMKNVDYTVLVLVLGCKTKVIYCFILKNKNNYFFFINLLTIAFSFMWKNTVGIRSSYHRMYFTLFISICIVLLLTVA